MTDAEKRCREVYDARRRHVMGDFPEYDADDIPELLDDIDRLREWVDDLHSGMYINCVYCGHRYGPDDGNHLVTMQNALREHVEQCPEHPMSQLKADNARLREDLEYLRDEYTRKDTAELARLRGLPERLMAVEVGRAGWEGNEDIITVSGKPVGCTYTREAARAIAGAWSWLLREVLKEADDE